MAADQAPSVLENLNTIASALQSVAATIALAAGAVWAYYRFVKDRVYRPRLDMEIKPIVYVNDGQRTLVSSLAVKNIGTSKLALLQKGSALSVSRAIQVETPHELPEWLVLGHYEVYPTHEWIESGETIRYDVAIPLSNADRLLSIKLRLLCKRGRRRIETSSRAILAPGSPEGDDG
jgi:hypothetical protein